MRLLEAGGNWNSGFNTGITLHIFLCSFGENLSLRNPVMVSMLQLCCFKFCKVQELVGRQVKQEDSKTLLLSIVENMYGKNFLSLEILAVSVNTNTASHWNNDQLVCLFIYFQWILKVAFLAAFSSKSSTVTVIDVHTSRSPELPYVLLTRWTYSWCMPGVHLKDLWTDRRHVWITVSMAYAFGTVGYVQQSVRRMAKHRMKEFQEVLNTSMNVRISLLH